MLPEEYIIAVQLYFMDCVNTNLILDLEIKEGRAKVAEDCTLKVKTSVYDYYSCERFITIDEPGLCKRSYRDWIKIHLNLNSISSTYTEIL